MHQNWELNGENHRMLFLQMAALNFPPFFPLCGYGQSWALQEPTRALLLTAWPPQTPAQARIRKPQVAGKEKLRVRPGAMEKAMATHSSTLAWKIPWMEESGRLQSMGWRRVGHDRATSLSLFTFMHWRRKWQPALVFLPGESQGRRSLVGCHLWGRTELDKTEAT